MIAFHGKQETKDFYVARVHAHQVADEIIHGKYWENGRGCAVGCSIHGADHSRYETELGIPVILARLEDRIFEGMQNGDSKEFPLRFLSAIEPGADLSLIWHQFAHWLLVDPKDGVLQYAKPEKTKDAIQLVANLCGRAARGLLVEQREWVSARKVAYADADAAYADAAYAYADADAAYADAAYAYAAAAAYAAADAAAAYADADAYAADAAAAYADAYAYAAAADAYAADAAAYAADAAAAWRSAKSKAYKRQADKLIELLAAAPVPIVEPA